MVENEALTNLFEALLDQTKAVRDLKIQCESLKQMLFAYRPAFEPAFGEQANTIAASAKVEQLDAFIERLEGAVNALKRG